MICGLIVGCAVCVNLFLLRFTCGFSLFLCMAFGSFVYSSAGLVVGGLVWTLWLRGLLCLVCFGVWVCLGLVLTSVDSRFNSVVA